ncbi:hypothetical protein ABID19_002915 [Mesorhizobium robiniae]|uniref:Secreted protein n=1 Tax=Mesorhizobium robiniae TaxID=559315 RepID=A0ABV2GNN5_9HYPH
MRGAVWPPHAATGAAAASWNILSAIPARSRSSISIGRDGILAQRCWKKVVAVQSDARLTELSARRPVLPMALPLRDAGSSYS